MTPKIRERLLNLAVTVVTAFGAVFLSFALFSGEAKTLREVKVLEKKADIDYVDNQDLQIQENFENYVETHADRHSYEYQVIQSMFESQNEKLDLIVRWIENERR